MLYDAKPIPAFYCCYLLRSIEKRSALYIGSTPNPLRRLAQHNGDAKGGAIRTARLDLRPWEMTCIVAGFPSNIAALQFEWAWNNSHLTKRIAEEQRITVRKTKVNGSPKTTRTRRRPARPRATLTGIISNLHLLLRVPGFNRWPLEVRFFCKDVYDVWVRWSERVDGQIQSGIKILLDVKQPEESSVTEEVPPSAQIKSTRKPKAIGTGGVDGVDVGYSKLKEYLEKSLLLLAEGKSNTCAVCAKEVGVRNAMVLVCSHKNCSSVFHLTCLAQRFLNAEKQEGLIFPTSGTCPQCGLELQWIDLVKEMSLRIRGERDVARLMKKPKVRKTKTSKGNNKISPVAVEGTENDSEREQDSANNDSDAANDFEEALPSDWQQEENEDDRMSMTSAVSDSSYLDAPSPTGSKFPQSRLGIVIEDSDWDDAEVLD